MKILIVEDEIHNSRLLKGMIKQLRPDWEILESLESVKSSVKWLNENPHPDLIYMDIQLTDGICFSIFDQVEIDSFIIFTTAYNEYAVRAFDVNSIDYLLKPIKSELLGKAILKFEKLYKQMNIQNERLSYEELMLAIKKGSEKVFRKRFLVAGATAFFKINVSEVAYFYTENRVSFAVDFSGKEHVLDLTMEKLEEQLNPDLFFRANRSVILNSETVHKIEAYFGGKLIVKLIQPFTEPVTISRLKATEFKNWLDN